MLVKGKELFKDDWVEKRILFCVTEDDAQIVAQRRLGRELTEEELHSVGKGVECGLSEGLMTVLETAIDLAKGKQND